ncbi:ABC transporter ATP-binding protein [Methylocella tundrae]|uniref:ABC transporter n=1 Tax=Methylocella tundrae TaxID=227605 RepID=A0A4U8Z1A3_METTU|nr:ABC transporter ATP-binding protein [Methylocella tundrae]WPP03110.1 ABC transporter ATP-binding protein [Methylocella tundrae]VFU09069.1 ABC transporter [Methylocella tundrae]
MSVEAMTPPFLQLRGVAFSYRGHAILKGLSLDVGRSEIVALLGGNGAGKSTLLRLALGLLSPASGEIFLDGRAISGLTRREIARRLAYVPQAHVAPFPYEARDVVMLGRLAENGLFRAPGASDHACVAAAFERLGVGHLARRRYTELSGGERQMVLIARALAQGAPMLVLDEPAAALDFGRQIELLRQLQQLAADGYGVLMTTHHPDHALASATRVVLLKDGVVLRQGRPAETLTPKSIFDLYGVRVAASALPGLFVAAGGLQRPT